VTGKKSTTGDLRAGIARELISPPRGLYLIGYGDRTKGNVGVHDPLTATALVLKQNERRLALVTCDLLCINAYVVDRVRATLGDDVNVIISCSHTHAGPITYADWRSNPRRRAYVRRLVRTIVRAIQRASANMAPAWLRGGRTTTDIAVNRRASQADGGVDIGVNPEGPVDRTVNVLSVDHVDGRPLATVVNLACHGTVLGPENRWVSADWIGALRAGVEAARGGLTLFLQGATADLNPVSNALGMDEAPWAAVEALGGRVAEAVGAMCDAKLAPLDGTPLRWQRREILLPLEAEVATSRPPRTYRRVLAESADLPRFLSFAVDLLLWRRYPWRSRVVAHDGRWSVPLRVNAVRLGDVSLLTFGAEMFTEIGQTVKRAAPSSLRLFASVTDGCIGYLPTADEHARGGPEVDLFSYFYRYPARFAPQSAQIAADAALDLLSTLY
jgi:hypothetical protein